MTDSIQNPGTFVITFDETTRADQNKLAASLLNALRESHPDVQIERNKPDASTMDFGSTLVLTLGAPATIAAAHALQAWLTRNNAAQVTIRTADGVIIAKNLQSKDVAALAEVLRPSR
jgi:Effector Associated Constant Component 1